MDLPRATLMVVLMLAAVRFVDVLDFMIVMPLGPDFAQGLKVAVSNVGIIDGSYTLASAFSGVLGSVFLDRMERRRALLIALMGLLAGTALAAMATSFGWLIAARVVAGLFGGPTTAVALSIVADAVPPQRRGFAMGMVMSAYGLAMVAGVPVALELGQIFGWRGAFWGVAAFGTGVWVMISLFLPSFGQHLSTEVEPTGNDTAFLRSISGRPVMWISLVMAMVVMLSFYLVVPNWSALVQNNLGFPREELGLLYFVGGVVALLAMAMAGPLVDRFGYLKVTSLASLLLLGVLVETFWRRGHVIPVMVVFSLFMFTNSFRLVAFNALVSQIPMPKERGRFMSILTATLQLASAVGAFGSAEILSVRSDGTLQGMGIVAGVAMVFTVGFLPLVWLVERHVRTQPNPPEVHHESIFEHI